MTTSPGHQVGDRQNSPTAGPPGPFLAEDCLLLEKTARFNRGRIPERVVHAKGSGAHGTFTVSGVRPTPHAARAAFPSASTPKKATGT
jgi:catalase